MSLSCKVVLSGFANGAVYPCGYDTVYPLYYAGTLLFSFRLCIVFVGCMRIHVYNLAILYASIEQCYCVPIPNCVIGKIGCTFCFYFLINKKKWVCHVTTSQFPWYNLFSLFNSLYTVVFVQSMDLFLPQDTFLIIKLRWFQSVDVLNLKEFNC